MIVVNFFVDRCCRKQGYAIEVEKFQEISRTPKEYAIVAQRFMFWVKEYQHHGVISLRSKLLEWMKHDLGYKYTVKYKDFTAIAMLVLDQDSIPSPDEFWKAYDEARLDHLGPEREVCFEPKVLQNIGGI